jgi:hypothetical protein
MVEQKLAQIWSFFKGIILFILNFFIFFVDLFLFLSSKSLIDWPW